MEEAESREQRDIEKLGNDTEVVTDLLSADMGREEKEIIRKWNQTTSPSVSI